MINVSEFLENTYGRKSALDSNAKSRMDSWLSWYRGENDFYRYSVYNGQKHIPLIRKSLNMIQAACRNWADLLLNEKCSVSVGSYQNELDNVFMRNGFWKNANHAIEKIFASGAGAFVLCKDSGVRIDFVDGNRCHPLSWGPSGVVECAFENEYVIGGDKLKLLSVHLLENGRYNVYNHAFDKKGEVFVDSIIPKFVSGSVPHFVFLRPQTVNSADFDSPFGEACFASAIDAARAIDLCFDSLCNEFSLGKKRIMVSSRATRISKEDGSVIPVFDSNDVVFHTLAQSDGDMPLIKEIDMDLRVDDHEKALNLCLNLFASLCGFGEKYYTFSDNSLRTATQVISENSSLFRSVKKHELMLADALRSITLAVFDLLALPLPENVNIIFDDSIIEDKDTQMKRDLQLVSSGVLKPWEFRVKWFGDDENYAREQTTI